MQYLIRKKLVALGDDFWVEDDEGQRIFHVDGKALRLRKTFVIETPEGDELVQVKERKVSLRKTMTIERQGEEIATVRKALVTPLRDRFEIEVGRRRAERSGRHARPRVHDRVGERRPVRPGLQALVHHTGLLRARHRARPRRGAGTGDRDLHRRDGSRRRLTARTPGPRPRPLEPRAPVATHAAMYVRKEALWKRRRSRSQRSA
jgi:hypothetical protein